MGSYVEMYQRCQHKLLRPQGTPAPRARPAPARPCYAWAVQWISPRGTKSLYVSDSVSIFDPFFGEGTLLRYIQTVLYSTVHNSKMVDPTGPHHDTRVWKPFPCKSDVILMTPVGLNRLQGYCYIWSCIADQSGVRSYEGAETRP